MKWQKPEYQGKNNWVQTEMKRQGPEYQSKNNWVQTETKASLTETTEQSKEDAVHAFSPSGTSAPNSPSRQNSSATDTENSLVL